MPFAADFPSRTDKSLRLFVALPVPDSLKRVVAALPRKGVAARWTHPDDLHITLRFLGEVEEARIEEIDAELGRVRRPPLGVELQGLGFFDVKKNPVLYARVESVRKLTTLCAEITDVLTPLGFDFGTRPYAPHVTLARFDDLSALQHYIRTLPAQGGAFRAGWQAPEFGLMASGGPDQAGRRYRILANYPLTG